MFALTTVVVLFSLSYTFALFLVSRRRSGSLLPPPDRLFFVFVLPCLNEAVVIERTVHDRRQPDDRRSHAALRQSGDEVLRVDPWPA